MAWWSIQGRHCEITIEPRPVYCDRGRWWAKVWPQVSRFDLDHHDGFPRFFFDLDRAKLEMEAWLHFRKEWVPDSTWELRDQEAT